MRTLIAMAAGSGIIVAAVARLPPEILVYQHSVRAEQLHTGNDFGTAFAGMDAIIPLQPRHDLGLPDGFDFKCAGGAFAAGRIGVSSIDRLGVCSKSPNWRTPRPNQSSRPLPKRQREGPGDVRVFDGMEFVWITARSKAAKPIGLHDMLGKARESVEDWHHKSPECWATDPGGSGDRDTR